MKDRKGKRKSYEKHSKMKLALEALNSPLPEMGVTKREAIWKKNKTTLWYYPPSEKKFLVPVFLVYSLVNQPVILDLGPGMSLVEAFVNDGFEVYLLDFGIPGYEDGDISIDKYIVDYIRVASQKTLRHSGAQELSVMGFCLGGTMAAMYASIADEPIKNLILSGTPVDFSHSPFDQWAEALREDSINFDDLWDILQIIPASAMKQGTRLITTPLSFSPYLSLLNKADDPEYVEKWRRINAWTNGHIPLTGAVVKQLMNDLFKHNRLIEDNLLINGKRASLTNIKSSVLVVSGENDSLVPMDMITPIMKLLSSQDKALKVLKSGHIFFAETGGLPEYIAEWLPSRSVPIGDL
ncbi:alpha/beta fold hydrolase [Peribacillus sp. SCS-155]|uniref:alpha/beta fold hydrolase n=1 Tax=Peribacillus sedimenti TaxID=3115297 RepID=UPI003906D248